MLAKPLIVVPAKAAQSGHDDHIALARARYTESLNLRRPIEPLYDEATQLVLPGRAGFTVSTDSHEIYDDTATNAVPEFASSIQGAVVPPFSVWARHLPGEFFEDEDERKELLAELSVVDRYIFQTLNSSTSSMDIHETFIDLALGTGCLRVDPGIAVHPLNVRAVELRSYSFTVGADNMPDGHFETRMLTEDEMRIEFPGIQIPPTLFEKKNVGEPEHVRPRRKIVEGWIRDWSSPAAARWLQLIFFPDAEYFIGLDREEVGTGAVPYICFRWSKGSGEAWGRGPLVNTLPSIRTVNFAMSAVIDHSDLALAGIWNYDDDGVINPDTFTLEPGTMVPRAPGSRGLENLRPGQGFDIQQFMIEEMRSNIRKALYVDELGDPNRSPKTATEVQQRMANLARRIGSSYNRLTMELALPLLARVARVLKKRGLIKLPAVDGERLTVSPSSPLSQAQTYDELERLSNAIGMVAQAYGPEAVSLEFNQQRTTSRITELFQVDPAILNNKEEKASVVAAAAQMAAGGEGGPGDVQQEAVGP